MANGASAANAARINAVEDFAVMHHCATDEHAIWRLRKIENSSHLYKTNSYMLTINGYLM